MPTSESIFVAIVQFFSLSSEDQLPLTTVKIPVRSSRPASEVRDGQNDLLGLVYGYCAYYQPFFSETSRSVESCEMILEELRQMFDLMLASPDASLWTQQGLRTAPIWRVARRLAKQACQALGVATGAPPEDELKIGADSFP
jgi:hypothetical protein